MIWIDTQGRPGPGTAWMEHIRVCPTCHALLLDISLPTHGEWHAGQSR